VIVAYVSGHGYGHATRVGEVLRTVRSRAPEARLTVVTSGPERLYRTALPGPFDFRVLACDVGIAQGDALSIDVTETERRCRELGARFARVAADEAAWLRASGARVVLGDVPPLAFAAAAAAGLPGVALANFSWDWIYRHMGLAEAAEQAAAEYAKAALLLELPFAGDLSVFPRRERVPLVARRPRLTRDDARSRLGLADGPVVLLSFGGFGLPSLDHGPLADAAGYTFLTTDGEGPLPANVRRLDAAALPRDGLAYVDLVAAADIVVTKPGYGIVSDAVAARTRLVYTERGDFPEYEILVRELPRWLPCRHVGNADLAAGRLQPALREVLAEPWPAPPADVRGAEVAAERLLALA
jgi:L-arabinokinase